MNVPIWIWVLVGAILFVVLLGLLGVGINIG